MIAIIQNISPVPRYRKKVGFTNPITIPQNIISFAGPNKWIASDTRVNKALKSTTIKQTNDRNPSEKIQPA